MTFFIMIRHGESSGNIKRIISHDYDGFPLTRRGRKQASIVGKELKSLKIEKLFVSPILRTKETAEIIAGILGCSIVVDERLRERCFGEFNNRNVNEIDWKTLLIKGEYKRVEPWENMYSRVLDFVKDRKEDIVVMVSHYDPIRVLITKRLGLDDELSSYGIVIPNASSSIIARNNEGNDRVIAIGIPPEKMMLRKYLSNQQIFDRS